MAYEQRFMGRQKALYNFASNVLTCQLIKDGAKVTPTSATITIYRRGSTTALVTAAAMTVSGTLLTYTLDTTTVASWPVETGYRAEVSIVYAAVTYKRHFVFDVVKFLLDLSVGVDQLIDIDDNAAHMVHNGDSDLAGLIVGVRAVIQARLESKALKDDKLVENMIIDPAPIGTAACFYVLAQLWMNKGNMEKYQHYRAEYDALLDAILSTMKYDEGQDGDEDAEIGGIQEVRLET